MLNFIHPIIAQGGAQGGNSGLIMNLVFIGGLIAVFYFFMIRPQQKRAKEHQNLLGSLNKGDKVITSSGIYATVVEVEEKTITLQISDNTKVKFDKTVIQAKI